MHRRFGRFFAAFFVAIALLGTALPAAALKESEWALKGIDPLADLIFLRPLGLVAVGAGLVLFIPVAPLALITRPVDGLPEAFTRLIWAPIKYVWVDPLGSHI
jgi:hypothetical protein